MRSFLMTSADTPPAEVAPPATIARVVMQAGHMGSSQHLGLR